MANFITTSSYHLILSVSLLLSLLTRSSTSHRLSPVVGILSQPRKDKEHDYIAASYVKWLESAGARSIAIPYDASDSLVEEIFSQVNGIFFPGGASELPRSARKLWKLAMESNERGEYFPVWGTCLGFEFIVTLAAEAEEKDGADLPTLQSGFNSENISLPLLFPTEREEEETGGVFSQESQLFPSGSTVRDIVTTQNVTMNNHHLAITPERFLSKPGLTSLFRVTSTNVDRDGRPFVSTIESFRFPIYATQYHPEKNNFEYGSYPNSNIPYEAINHSRDAISVSTHLAEFFVDQVRKSTLGNYDKVDKHPLLYQYEMLNGGNNFEQIFIIPRASHWRIEGGKPSIISNHGATLRGSVNAMTVTTILQHR